MPTDTSKCRLWLFIFISCACIDREGAQLTTVARHMRMSLCSYEVGRFMDKQVPSSLLLERRRSILVVALTLIFASLTSLVLNRGDAGAQDSCDALQLTPQFTIIYGSLTLDDDAAPAGTVVEAVTPRGELAGCFVVTAAGFYGAMYVYGEDATVSPTIPGMRSGESIQLRVNGVSADMSVALEWLDDRDLHAIDITARGADTTPAPGTPGTTRTPESTPANTLTPTSTADPQATPTPTTAAPATPTPDPPDNPAEPHVIFLPNIR